MLLEFCANLRGAASLEALAPNRRARTRNLARLPPPSELSELCFSVRRVVGRWPPPHRFIINMCIIIVITTIAITIIICGPGGCGAAAAARQGRGGGDAPRAAAGHRQGDIICDIILYYITCYMI